MAFEVLESGLMRANRTPAGRWRLDKSGQVTVAAADLAAAKIAFEVTALICPLTKRVAIRAPRDGELRTFRLGRGAKAPEAKLLTRNGSVQLRAAWAKLGVDPAKKFGEYALATKDDLLILKLTTPAEAQRIAGNKPAKK